MPPHLLKLPEEKAYKLTTSRRSFLLGLLSGFGSALTAWLATLLFQWINRKPSSLESVPVLLFGTYSGVTQHWAMDTGISNGSLSVIGNPEEYQVTLELRSASSHMISGIGMTEQQVAGGQKILTGFSIANVTYEPYSSLLRGDIHMRGPANEFSGVICLSFAQNTLKGVFLGQDSSLDWNIGSMSLEKVIDYNSESML